MAAGADTVYYVGPGYGTSVGTALMTSGGYQYRTGFAGEIRLSWYSNETDPFAAYCLTLSQNLLDPETVNKRPLSQLPDSGNPPYADTGSGEYIAWLLNRYAFGVDSNDEGAALQVAVWEVLYDRSAAGGYNLRSGDFYVQNGYDSIVSLASSYLAGIGTSEAIWLDSYGVNDAGYYQRGQDYGVPVPEPGLLLLLGLGLGALGLTAHRRRR